MLDISPFFAEEVSYVMKKKTKHTAQRHVTHKKHFLHRTVHPIVAWGAIVGLALLSIFMMRPDWFTPAPHAASNGNVQGTNTGFDIFGYNYQARLFSGKADGVDRILDGKVDGDPTYANDHLVMKWSKAWDDARFHGAAWTPAAWVDNEWNGKLPNGSDVSEHVKIVWVGPQLESSQYWKAGGYPIWGQFEVIMDQGMSGTTHFQYAHAQPSGYGAYK